MPGRTLTFDAVLYCAVSIALTVCTCIGIPWTPQILGTFIFLSALPFLWLNERREARMAQLVFKAASLATPVDANDIKPAMDGHLVFTSDSLHRQEDLEELVLPRWGVVAPADSLGLRATVEIFRPSPCCSWRRLFCPNQKGQWLEGVAEVSSEETWVPKAKVGSYVLSDEQLFYLDGWLTFSPPHSERFVEVLKGTDSTALGGAVHTVRRTAAEATAALTSIPGALGMIGPKQVQQVGPVDSGSVPLLPIPGERPQVISDNSMLYYPRGGGHPAHPQLGDLRVSFFFLPGGDNQIFTAVGVQRGYELEPFRFRAPPPRGVAIGEFETRDFNIGLEHNANESLKPMLEEEAHGLVSLPFAGARQQTGAVWEFQQDDMSWAQYDPRDSGMLEAQYQSAPEWSGRKTMGPKKWRYKLDFKSMAQVNPKTSKRRSMRRRVEDAPWTARLPFTMQVVLVFLVASLDGWRIFLHKSVGEELPCLAPGRHWISTFFLRSHAKELILAWRLRCMGLMLMAAGVEVAFWQWEAQLALLGGMFINYGLWVISLVAAGGFTAVTVAAASLYYRPVVAVLNIVCAFALFTALFGGTQLIVALVFVAICMVILTLLFGCHLMLPC